MQRLSSAVTSHLPRPRWSRSTSVFFFFFFNMLARFRCVFFFFFLPSLLLHGLLRASALLCMRGARRRASSARTGARSGGSVNAKGTPSKNLQLQSRTILLGELASVTQHIYHYDYFIFFKFDGDDFYLHLIHLEFSFNLKSDFACVQYQAIYIAQHEALPTPCSGFEAKLAWIHTKRSAVKPGGRFLAVNIKRRAATLSKFLQFGPTVRFSLTPARQSAGQTAARQMNLSAVPIRRAGRSRRNHSHWKQALKIKYIGEETAEQPAA